MANQYLCEICNQPGAKFRRYTRVMGFIVISTSNQTKPRPLCDKHKVRGGMDVLLMNLFLGWWGIAAFFWNIFAIIGILMGGTDVTAELEAAYAQKMQENVEAIERSSAS